MIHNKNHLIRPGCLWTIIVLTVQNRGLKNQSFIHSFCPNTTAVSSPLPICENANSWCDGCGNTSYVNVFTVIAKYMCLIDLLNLHMYIIALLNFLCPILIWWNSYKHHRSVEMFMEIIDLLQFLCASFSYWNFMSNIDLFLCPSSIFWKTCK